MARSKSDISNSAIRIFLQNVGKYYDEARGLEPFGPKVSQKEELLQIFNHIKSTLRVLFIFYSKCL